MQAGPSTSETVTAVWRGESARLVAALVRITGDLALAEDLAQDALVAALEQWPRDGVPARPGAWLMTVAKRRAMDHFRRAQTDRRKLAEIADALEEVTRPDPVDSTSHIEDDVLRLVFLTCHPSLPPEARAALTLRLVCGLTTREIARGFLAKDATIGQRISRAKRTLTEAGLPLDLPTGADRTARLGDVLAVIYLVFNEGYTATAGEDWLRPDLCIEAIRLARLVAELSPDEPEAHGLQALLELQASRIPARTDAEGNPLLLDDQDRRLWDRLLVHRGLAALGGALTLTRRRPGGPYVVQAMIAACHARATTAAETPWEEIAHLYDLLAEISPGPVVEVNRAVAHGRAHGADAGLAVLQPLLGDPALAASHLLSAVHGDLLERAGRDDEAARAFREAAGLTGNAGERRVLLDRAEKVGGPLSK